MFGGSQFSDFVMIIQNSSPKIIWALRKIKAKEIVFKLFKVKKIRLCFRTLLNSSLSVFLLHSVIFLGFP